MFGRGHIDALYLDEVARARAMRPDDKLLEGPRLFERACRLMAEGIRHEHPELDEAGVRRMLDQRLAIAEAGAPVTGDDAIVATLTALDAPRSHT